MINAGRMLVRRNYQTRRVRTPKAWLSTAIRWAARTLSGLLAALMLSIVLCHAFSPEGLPNPFTQPPDVQLEFAGMLLMWSGWILGWKWEGIGGLLALCGIMIFHVVEAKIWLGYGLADLVGILFLLSWWLRKRQRARSVDDRKRGQEHVSEKDD
ncbi:MAG: DUF7670 domain-containing protein [Planctomycetota bacterium]|jgi:hypothetical protein